MIITCGQCQAKFKVAPEQIKETGSKVRCSNCQYVFTVYRPQRAAKPDAPGAGRKTAAGKSGEGLDDFLKSLGGQAGGTAGRKAGRQAPPSAAAAPTPNEDDDLDDLFDGDHLDDQPHLTVPADAKAMKARRAQRRRLYSDLEDQPAKTEAEDDLEGLFEDEPDDQPHLRRSRPAPAPAPEPEPEPEDDEDEEEESDEFEEDFEDVDEEREEADGEDDGEEYDDDGEYEDEEEETASARSGLGLGVDPSETDYAGTEPRPRGVTIGLDAREPVSVRPAIIRTKKSHRKLLLILAVVAAVLAIGIFFLANRPEPTALSGGEEAASSGDAAQPPAGPPGSADSTGTESITFTKGNQNHYFRENPKAGKILIITGMVRNSYPEPRSFIRLRGLLLSGDGDILADRFVYAGNIISEEDLSTLPISEILARLQIKSGQNELNMNIQPNQEIPFMLVFDKLPEGMEQYRIDPVGSAPAN